MKDFQRVYFLGIGGIGMSALARYFNAMGKVVAGYDKTPSALLSQLQEEGIAVHFDDDVNHIPSEFKDPDSTLVVYTPAVPNDHSELGYFRQNNFSLEKRAVTLGRITSAAYTVAVAGTHGKTTTSSLIAHILKEAGLDPSAFLGGITQNYGTNLLLSKKLGGDEKDLVVVEADEFDRSFLTLHPDIAIITSMDADHLDIYGDHSHVEESFSLFAAQVKGHLVVNSKIAGKLNNTCPLITYSISAEADYAAENIRISNGDYVFDLRRKAGLLRDLTLGLPGKHNVENAVAAVAVAELMNVREEVLRSALAGFRGVRRRFDYHIKKEKQVYIDDYAHHPEELRATISSVREMYPGKKITGIFQPHLFSRTRDFATEFAQSLDLLDDCILLPVYPAREKPIAGVSSEMLIEGMKGKSKCVCEKKDLLQLLEQKKPELLLTMGAGDIDAFIQPITELLDK